MLSQLAIGFGFSCATVLIAVVFIVMMTATLDRADAHTRLWVRPFRESVILLLAVIWLLLGILLVVACWAWLFGRLGAFSDFATSFYFAIVATTTVGFGDITLPPETRILAGFAAADGFIIFGLDTAVLFEVIRRIRESSKMRNLE